MKATMKKIVIGVSALTMAVCAAASGIGVSAAEKHPGESGYRYYANEQVLEDQPGRPEDEGALYGKHPGEAGFCEAQRLFDIVQTLTDEQATELVDFFYANGYINDDLVEKFRNEVNEFGKHPGESGFCYSAPEEGIALEAQPGRPEDEGALYGKHPGEAGFCEAQRLFDIVQTLTDDQAKELVDFFYANGYINDDLVEKFRNEVNEFGKHPGESGFGYQEDQNDLGYDPSKYTEDQIRIIEASRNMNGFVCGTLLMKYDEENAAAAAQNEKHPGEAGFCYQADKNDLGYDPSKYTEDQIRMIEASRDMNGFVCGTLLMQFDEENAAAAAKSEKKSGEPQHAYGLKVAGDVNCDGVVDVTDSVLLSRFVNEDKDAFLTAQGKINADVDNDGSITMEDNTALLQIIAKLR